MLSTIWRLAFQCSISFPRTRLQFYSPIDFAFIIWVYNSPLSFPRGRRSHFVEVFRIFTELWSTKLLIQIFSLAVRMIWSTRRFCGHPFALKIWLRIHFVANRWRFIRLVKLNKGANCSELQSEDEAHLIRFQSLNVRSKMAALVSSVSLFHTQDISGSKFQCRSPEFNLKDFFKKERKLRDNLFTSG